MDYVSVCVPVWNRPEFLPFLTRNLLCQDYPREYIEVVIDDDGFSDSNTKPFFKDEAELDSFKKQVSPIKVQYLKENERRSIGKKRNNLIFRASYEIIAYMDSDDLYNSTYLSYSIDLLKKNKFGLVGCPNLIMFYEPYTSDDLYYLNCGDRKDLIHECSMVFYKKWFRKTRRYFNDSSRAEGGYLLKNNTNKVGVSDVTKCMLQVCHHTNTIDKSPFKKVKMSNVEIDPKLTELIQKVVKYKEI